MVIFHIVICKRLPEGRGFKVNIGIPLILVFDFETRPVRGYDKTIKNR